MKQQKSLSLNIYPNEKKRRKFISANIQLSFLISSTEFVEILILIIFKNLSLYLKKILLKNHLAKTAYFFGKPTVISVNFRVVCKHFFLLVLIFLFFIKKSIVYLKNISSHEFLVLRYSDRLNKLQET